MKLTLAPEPVPNTPNPANSILLSLPEQKIPDLFTNHRIVIANNGKCFGSLNGKTLSVDYCNPLVDQQFSLTKHGKLLHQASGLCVAKSPKSLNTAVLALTDDCARAPAFRVVGDTLRHGNLCLSPTRKELQWLVPVPILNPVPGCHVCLTKCDELASRITIISEARFIEDRKALLVDFPPGSTSPSCSYPACAINLRRPPSVHATSSTQPCSDLRTCVTIVTKTARRPLLVLRLAQSVRKHFGHDLPIIAVDDGPEPHPKSVRVQLAGFPLLTYVVVNQPDIGISAGRNIALERVTTRYIFLLDDDCILNKHTDLGKMVEILDSTDATLVGGKFTDYVDFAGFMEFEDTPFGRTLSLYSGTCTATNRTVPAFPDCVNCDLTTNVFVARTADLREVGGWSGELKVQEHKDIFLRLKSAGKKVVFCEGFQAYNRRIGKLNTELQESNYEELRRGKERRALFNELFRSRWGVERVAERTPNETANISLSRWSLDFR